MSALGQKQTSRHLQRMSALPPKADIGTQPPDVRFVPKADIATDQLNVRLTPESRTFGSAHLREILVMRRCLAADQLSVDRR